MPLDRDQREQTIADDATPATRACSRIRSATRPTDAEHRRDSALPICEQSATARARVAHRQQAIGSGTSGIGSGWPKSGGMQVVEREEHGHRQAGDDADQHVAPDVRIAPAAGDAAASSRSGCRARSGGRTARGRDRSATAAPASKSALPMAREEAGRSRRRASPTCVRRAARPTSCSDEHGRRPRGTRRADRRARA